MVPREASPKADGGVRTREPVGIANQFFPSRAELDFVESAVTSFSLVKAPLAQAEKCESPARPGIERRFVEVERSDGWSDSLIVRGLVDHVVKPVGGGSCSRLSIGPIARFGRGFGMDRVSGRRGDSQDRVHDLMCRILRDEVPDGGMGAGVNSVERPERCETLPRTLVPS